MVVSLTSYPPRFPTLALTLKSLLMQSPKPTVLVLWVTAEDFALLPQDVLNLADFGLTIKTCEDLRSYKKLMPSLSEFPSLPIVVCDDDTYYWPTWLQSLYSGWSGNRNEVACLRPHLIKTAPKGDVLPYREWEYETDSIMPSRKIFPTGCGGILFPPGVFDERVFDKEVFMSICSRADDVWFYWMAALNGAIFKKVPGRRYFVTWSGSQQVSLVSVNAQSNNLNDLQIASMIEKYGIPWA